MRMDRRQDDESAPQAKPPPLVFGDPESIARMQGRGIQARHSSGRGYVQSRELAAIKLIIATSLAVTFLFRFLQLNYSVLELSVSHVLILLFIAFVCACILMISYVIIDAIFRWTIRLLDWLKARLNNANVPKGREWETNGSLSGIDYYSYLESNEWKQRRDYMVQRAGFRCERCSRHGLLEVHHRTYKRLGNERLEDLVVLCSDCHELVHSQRSVSP